MLYERNGQIEEESLPTNVSFEKWAVTDETWTEDATI